MLLVILILNIIFYSNIAIAEEAMDVGEITVGIITLSPPEEYVVIEEVETKKRRLYKKEDYEKIKNKNLKFIQSVTVDTIEYRYKPIHGKMEFASRLFELVEIKDKKAVLKRDYLEVPEGITEEEELPEEVIETEEELAEPEEEPKKEITAKRLVAELFFKIESKKLSEHEWEINLPTILDAAINFGNVLSIVIKKLDELIEPEKKSRVYFSTSLGKGALGSDGILIESLNSRLRAKCGIKDDDLIKMVNGKNLTTIQDVAAIFSGLDLASPQTVTVKLVRDETDLTLTYYIR